MKATGIVRRIDDLGRIVIPKEIRRTHSIAESDPIEIFTDANDIILRKYTPGCMFCGTNDASIVEIGDKMICPECARKLLKTAEGGKSL